MMIRFRRLTTELLDAWLVSQRLDQPRGRYRLRLWRENPACFEAIRGELTLYIDEAFDDARRRLRRGFEDDLSPFNDPPRDPAANYPALLHRTTLLGYFGEILAVAAVEHWGGLGHMDWSSPAFLFRFHDQEFQHLELINERMARGEPHEPDMPRERRPGRTGDDALAFRMNGDNVITDILTIEAKCLVQNNARKIEEAHQKLAEAGPRPSGIRELINILADYDTPEANAWQEALLRLWKSGYQTARRCDGVAYACGHSPARGDRVAWMPVDAPHAAYSVDRDLVGMEFQFDDLDRVILALYRGE